MATTRVDYALEAVPRRSTVSGREDRWESSGIGCSARFRRRRSAATRPAGTEGLQCARRSRGNASCPIHSRSLSCARGGVISRPQAVRLASEAGDRRSGAVSRRRQRAAHSGARRPCFEATSASFRAGAFTRPKSRRGRQDEPSGNNASRRGTKISVARAPAGASAKPPFARRLAWCRSSAPSATRLCGVRGSRCWPITCSSFGVSGSRTANPKPS